MTMPWSRVSGKIIYRDAGGAERGREWFSMHTLERGGRTCRAVCEMDNEEIIRDATWDVNANWTPVGGFVQCVVKSEIAGRSWYDIHNKTVACEGNTLEYGRISQSRTLKAPIQFLGLHPVFADGIIAAVRGRTEPGVEKIITGVTCSYSKNGETDLIALPIDIGVTYVGPERVKVSAGEFDGHRFNFKWRQEWPPATYWVYGDNFIYLKHEWSVSGLSVELVELET